MLNVFKKLIITTLVISVCRYLTHSDDLIMKFEDNRPFLLLIYEINLPSGITPQ